MQLLILNYERLGWYCDLMMRKGLIKYDPINHTYGITSQGIEVLRLYLELAGHLKPFNQMIMKYSYYLRDDDDGGGNYYRQELRRSDNLAKAKSSYLSYLTT